MNRKTLGLALLAAFLLRTIWALLVPVVPISDAAAYDSFARTLAEHGVFGWTAAQPQAFWPPGTTFLHAALYWAFGPNHGAIVAVNILLSLAMIVATARVASRLFDARAGELSAWILALWPTLIMYVTVLASELPFVLLITLALDVWTNRRLSAFSRGVIAGLILGAAALVRPLALALPFVFALASILSAARPLLEARRIAAAFALALVAMACVVAPWTLRNQQLFGETVLVSTNGGITFWMGNTPGTDGSYMPVPEEFANTPEDETEKILSARAWAYIKEDPTAFAARVVKKIVKLYGNESIGVVWNIEGIRQSFGYLAELPLKRFTQLTWFGLLVLGMIGLWTTLRAAGFWKTACSPAFASIAFFSLVYIVTVAQDRYHLSFASLLAIYMAVGLARILRTRPVNPTR